MILLDIPPPPFSDAASIAAGVGFFFIVAAIAIVTFILLKRSVRMGLRLTVATIILIVAVVGSVIISFIVAQAGYKPNRPPVNREKGVTIG